MGLFFVGIENKYVLLAYRRGNQKQSDSFYGLCGSLREKEIFLRLHKRKNTAACSPHLGGKQRYFI